MAIQNEEELKKLVGSELQKALDLVGMEILKQNKQEITDVVYSYPNQEYERTMEFRDAAWETTQEGSGDASVSFQYAPDKIHIIDAPKHAAIADGNGFQKGDSSTEYLADLIYQGHGGIKKMSGRNAFKKLDSWLSKSQLRKLVEDGLNHTALIWKRSTGGLNKTTYDKL